MKLALNFQDYDIWRPGVMGVVHALRRKARQIAESDFFNGFIMISVLVNTAILASTGLVSDSATPALSALNLMFTVIFSAEMVIKIFGFGPISESPPIS